MTTKRSTTQISRPSLAVTEKVSSQSRQLTSIYDEMTMAISKIEALAAVTTTESFRQNLCDADQTTICHILLEQVLAAKEKAGKLWQCIDR